MQVENHSELVEVTKESAWKTMWLLNMRLGIIYLSFFPNSTQVTKHAFWNVTHFLQRLGLEIIPCIIKDLKALTILRCFHKIFCNNSKHVRILLLHMKKLQRINEKARSLSMYIVPYLTMYSWQKDSAWISHVHYDFYQCN